MYLVLSYVHTSTRYVKEWLNRKYEKDWYRAGIPHHCGNNTRTEQITQSTDHQATLYSTFGTFIA